MKGLAKFLYERSCHTSCNIDITALLWHYLLPKLWVL